MKHIRNFILILLFAFGHGFVNCQEIKLELKEIGAFRFADSIIPKFDYYSLSDVRKTKDGVLLAFDSLIYFIDNKTGKMKAKIHFGKYKRKPRKVYLRNNHLYVLDHTESVAFHFEDLIFKDSVAINEQLDWFSFIDPKIDEFRWHVRTFLAGTNPDETDSGTKYPYIINLFSSSTYFYAHAMDMIFIYKKLPDSTFKEEGRFYSKFFSNNSYSFRGCLNDSLFFQINNSGIGTIINPYKNKRILFNSNSIDGKKYNLVGQYYYQPVYPKIDFFEGKGYLFSFIQENILMYEIHIRD